MRTGFSFSTMDEKNWCVLFLLFSSLMEQQRKDG
jgi:hypothetical protein